MQGSKWQLWETPWIDIRDGEQGGGEIQFVNILFYKAEIKSIKKYLKKMSLRSPESINY